MAAAAAAAKSRQLCPTLCDPIDGSPPGSPIPGILQASAKSEVSTYLFLPFAGEEQVVPAGFQGCSAEIDEYFLQNRGP